MPAAGLIPKTDQGILEMRCFRNRCLQNNRRSYIEHIEPQGNIKRMKIDRRTILKGVAVTLATPAILRAQTNTLRIGMDTVMSGTAAALGSSSSQGAKLRIDEINAAGGLGGRQLELVIRDTKAQPQEAARIVRELVNSEGCEIIIASDPNALAVQEIIRDLNVLCIQATSETTSYTADPKLRVPTSFRVCRQGIHDSILGGMYAADIAKKKGLKKWASISPDYSYGRETTDQFFKWTKHFDPDIEVVAQVWPRLGTPEYSELITRLLQARPQALYSTLWGGDLSSFVGQAGIYGFFSQVESFAVNLADYNVLGSIKTLPPGIHSGSRYLDNFPATSENKAWADKYRAQFKQQPTVWSGSNYLAVQFIETAAKQGGSLDNAALVKVLQQGLTVDSFMGQNGKVTMRPEDQTIVDYAFGWGTTVAQAPFVTDIAPGDWSQVKELELEWKKSMGYV